MVEKTEKKARPYERARNRTWLLACMSACGATSIRGFEDWFFKTGLHGYGEKQWWDYWGGVSPNADLVDIIDCQLEGTAEVFNEGLGGLPLWIALGQFEGGQNEVLDSFLIEHRDSFSDPSMLGLKALRGMSIEDKAFLIFNLTIPEKYKIKEESEKFDEGGNYEETLKWEYHFNEYSSLNNNVLFDYYKEGKEAKIAHIVKDKKQFLFSRYKLSNPIMVVIYMILTKLLTGELKEFFRIGLQEPIKDLFNEHVLDSFNEINKKDSR
jgi:hypothetical protein